MKLKSLDHLLQLVGFKLAELRRKMGYETIKEFANEFKLPLIQYWRIENGKTNPTMASLYKVLKIHKLSVLDFFCEIEGEVKKNKRG